MFDTLRAAGTTFAGVSTSETTTCTPPTSSSSPSTFRTSTCWKRAGEYSAYISITGGGKTMWSKTVTLTENGTFVVPVLSESVSLADFPSGEYTISAVLSGENAGSAAKNFWVTNVADMPRVSGTVYQYGLSDEVIGGVQILRRVRRGIQRPGRPGEEHIILIGRTPGKSVLDAAYAAAQEGAAMSSALRPRPWAATRTRTAACPLKTRSPFQPRRTGCTTPTRFCTILRSRRACRRTDLSTLCITRIFTTPSTTSSKRRPTRSTACRCCSATMRQPTTTRCSTALSAAHTTGAAAISRSTRSTWPRAPALPQPTGCL